MRKVSVVIPLYNKAEYIAETINSVLNQTYSDFDLIIVDDGSRDGSQDIVLQFKDPRIRFFQNECNKGTAGIGNQLLELCESDYIVRQDADDLMVPERLKWQLDYMEKNPDLGVSSGFLQVFGDKGIGEIWENFSIHKNIWARVLFQIPVYQPAAIIRNSVVRQYSLRYENPGPQIGEDWLFWYKFGKVSRYGNLDKVLIHYRRGEDNITNYSKFGFYEGRKQLYAYMFNDLGLPSDYIDIHFLTKPFFKEGLSPEQVILFRSWLDFLGEWNKRERVFDDSYFATVLSEKWKKLLYFLPEHGLKTVRAYKKVNGSYTFSQWKYLIKGLMKQKLIRK